MSRKILTANDLHSGGVIYAADNGNWSQFITQAVLSDEGVSEEKLISIGKLAVSTQKAVEPFLIDIEIENGIPVPVHFREQLRVNGPSVRSDFSKPHYYEAA
jgi:hypothetical protein